MNKLMYSNGIRLDMTKTIRSYDVRLEIVKLNKILEELNEVLAA